MMVSHVVFVSLCIFIVFFFAGIMVRGNPIEQAKFSRFGIIAMFIFFVIIDYHQLYVNPDYDAAVLFLLMGLLYLNIPVTPIINKDETIAGDLRFRRTKAYMKNMENSTSWMDKILNGAESLITKIKSIRNKK